MLSLSSSEFLARPFDIQDIIFLTSSSLFFYLSIYSRSCCTALSISTLRFYQSSSLSLRLSLPYFFLYALSLIFDSLLSLSRRLIASPLSLSYSLSLVIISASYLDTTGTITSGLQTRGTCELVQFPQVFMPLGFSQQSYMLLPVALLKCLNLMLCLYYSAQRRQCSRMAALLLYSSLKVFDSFRRSLCGVYTWLRCSALVLVQTGLTACLWGMCAGQSECCEMSGRTQLLEGVYRAGFLWGMLLQKRCWYQC